MRGVIVCGLCFFLPTVVSAAVTFSEVAWMGDTASANHEWLELHNDGETVDVTGWSVRDGANLHIELSGVIAAGAYVVLERSSEESAPGSAFLIYTGALVNTGTTLRLERSDGSIEDQVSGGENWQDVGGDNVTKETAQYTTGGWVTAVATPGRAIAADEVEVVVAGEETASVNNASPSVVQHAKSSEPVRLILPDVDLEMSIDAQKIGYVHQPIEIEVEPSGIGKTLIDSLQYEWNFGDGETATSKKVTHVYDYPGTYVVTVYGGFKRQEQVARHEITILPVAISLTTNEAGDAQVNNDSPYEIDISGYKVSGIKEFIFPPRSVMLPNQTVTIAKKKLGGSKNQLVTIYDTKSALIASSVPERLISPAQTETSDLSSESNVSSFSYATGVADAGSYKNAAVESREEMIPEVVVEPEPEQLLQLATVDAVPQSSSGERWPYAMFAIVLLLATLGVYVAPRSRNQPE